VKAVMTFGDDGTAQCLYHELIDLHELGHLACERASVIEFDQATQQWQVKLPDGDEVLFQHSSREACLDWEREELG
jgi:hypothetical protein